VLRPHPLFFHQETARHAVLCDRVEDIVETVLPRCEQVYVAYET